MATTSEIHKDIQKELECAICLQTLTQPKLLHCMHTFCLSCLKRLKNGGPADIALELTCPTCRHVTKVNESPEELYNNFIVQNVIEKLEALKLSKAGKYRCDGCDKLSAASTASYCVDCCMKFCQVCSDHHQNSVLFKKHGIKKMGDASLQDTPLFRKNICSKHGAVMKYFCKQCSKALCFDCTISRLHKDHVYMLLDEAMQEKKEELGKMIELANGDLQDFSLIIKRNADILAESSRATEISIQAVSNAIDQIIEELQNEKLHMVEELESKLHKVEQFCSQQKVQYKARENVITFAKSLAENLDGIQSPCMLGDLMDKLKVTDRPSWRTIVIMTLACSSGNLKLIINEIKSACKAPKFMLPNKCDVPFLFEVNSFFEREFHY